MTVDREIITIDYLVKHIIKKLSNSILEGQIFKNFLGGMPPEPPGIGMLCMHVCFAHSMSVHNF